MDVCMASRRVTAPPSGWSVNTSAMKGPRDGTVAENAVAGLLRAHFGDDAVRVQVPYADTLTASGRKHRVDVVVTVPRGHPAPVGACFEDVLVSVRHSDKGSNWGHDVLIAEAHRLAGIRDRGNAEGAFLVISGDGWCEDTLHGVFTVADALNVTVLRFTNFPACVRAGLPTAR